MKNVATSLYESLGIIILITVIFEHFGPFDTLLLIIGLLLFVIGNKLSK